MAKIENGATNCPILLIFTIAYRILYIKGNWIEEKNVITHYYIFFGFPDISETIFIKSFTVCKIQSPIG